MNKKLIIIVASVLLLFGIIGGVIFALLINGQQKEPQIVYSEYKLDEAYSNLADDGGSKIVKYQVVIEYTDSDIVADIESNKTKIVNNIDELMRVSLSEDLMKANGKERLRSKIRDMIIEVLDSDEDVISNIYIAPFIIQG